MPVSRSLSLRRAVTGAAFPTALVCAATLGVVTAPVSAQTLSRRPINLVNTKFATVSSGSQTAVRVAVPFGASEAETNAAVIRKLKATWAAQTPALIRSLDVMRREGLLKDSRLRFPVSTIVQVETNGKPVVTRAWRGRAVGGGALTFRYTGWSDQDRALIERLITAFTPRIEAVYGKPAVSGEVEIVNAGSLDNSKIPQVQRLFAFGGYNASGNQILLPVFVKDETFAQALLLNLIHAYHGPAVFQYDAWEQGFARAAASVVARTPDYGFADGSANNLFSLLRWYDLLNQPGLGNPTFFPPSQANIQLDATSGGFTLGKMTFPRIGMSGAAWLKVYIENPDFFRLFNEAYYARFDPAASPSLAGNVPELKNIAALLLPNGVEGAPFADWFARQYILDTSVSVGRKLYAFVIPGSFDATKGQSNLIQVIYYHTKPDGDEELLDGQVYSIFHDATGATVRLGVASEQVQLLDGEGSITTQSFTIGEGRLTLDFSVGTETARTYVPSGFTGNLQAVVLGANASGRAISVTQTTPASSASDTTTSANAGFGMNLSSAPNDLAKTVITYTDSTGAVKTFNKNTGDGQSYLVLRTNQNGGELSTVTKSFAVGQLPFFVSFPLQPLVTGVPDALGIGAGDFVLSYWDVIGNRYSEATADPKTSIGSLAAGRAYWFKPLPADRSLSSLAVRLTGALPVTDVDFPVAVRYGWNMIGTPFTNDTLIVKDIRVQDQNNNALSWDDAVAQNLVSAQPYRFDRSSGQFVVTDSINAPEWEGVFLRVLVPRGLTLLMKAPDATTRKVSPRSRAALASSSAPRPDWAVTLRTRQDADPRIGFFRAEATATFGVARGATDGYDNRLDQEEPPAVVPGVGVVFDAPTRGIKGAGGRFVADFRDAAKRENQWQFTSLAVAPGPVRLQWDNLNAVPRATRLLLTDTETGEVTPLRNRSSVVWTATDAKRSRRYTITAQPARTMPLMLSNIQISRLGGRAQGGAGGFGISYNVTSSAEVSVEVSALGGRLIRRLDNSGRAIMAGRQSLFWDGRAQDGGSLPAGAYLLKITARPTDGDGLPVTTIRPVQVLN